VLDHGDIVHTSVSADLMKDHATLERLLGVSH